MKNLICCLFVIAFYSCGKEKSNLDDKVRLDKTEKAKVQADSLVRVNGCHSDSFVSVLEENHTLEDNAFILTITSKDGLMKKVDTLNVRPSASHINYCTEDYVVVGFPCGGPCYSQVFVFTQDNRPDEQFDYAQRIYSNPNMIAHIENEEFEKLIIHNFNNGKELKIDIADANLLSYGKMDTIFVERNKLVIKYSSAENKTRKQVIDLETLLK